METFKERKLVGPFIFCVRFKGFNFLGFYILNCFQNAFHNTSKYSFQLSLSLSTTHAHTHVHTHSHANAHIRTHSHSNAKAYISIQNKRICSFNSPLIEGLMPSSKFLLPGGVAVLKTKQTQKWFFFIWEWKRAKQHMFKSGRKYQKATDNFDHPARKRERREGEGSVCVCVKERER